MATVETLLRALVEHPRRGLFVIILTCGLALLLIWPVVDEYFALVEESAELERSVAQAQREVSAARNIEQAASARASELAALRQQTLAAKDVHAFSSQLVELTRNAGCQLRRIDLGEVQRRKWGDDDHPLRPQAIASGKETPYELHTQRVTLSISGPLESVQSLIGKLYALEKMVHTQSLQLRPTDDSRSEVSLDLELLFFDLQRAKKPAAA
jgi:hypothetical protein